MAGIAVDWVVVFIHVPIMSEIFGLVNRLVICLMIKASRHAGCTTNAGDGRTCQSSPG